MARELDKLVAEIVFKQAVVLTKWGKQNQYCSYTIDEPDYMYTGDEPGGILTNSVPNYSSDMKSAFEIVDAINCIQFNLDWKSDSHSRWTCVFTLWNSEKHTIDKFEAHGNYASEAICLAALKVFEDGRETI